jgi:hypothetical protein
LAALLGQLVGGLSHLEDMILNSSTNVDVLARGESATPITPKTQ